MSPVRGLDQVLADLDGRQRALPASRNRNLTKFASVADSVTLSSDAVTSSLGSVPVRWAPAATTVQDLQWSSTVQGEWYGLRYAREVLLDRPVAYLPLSEMDPTNSANDATTNGYTGTVIRTLAAVSSGGSTFGPLFGMPGPFSASVATAARFTNFSQTNSSDQQISVSSNAFPIDGSAAFTVEAWVNPAASSAYGVPNLLPGSWGILGRIGSTAGNGGSLYVSLEFTALVVGFPGTYFRCIRVDAAGSAFAVASTSLTVSGWNHLVATYNSSSVNLWVNAVRASPSGVASTGKIPTGSFPFQIGTMQPEFAALGAFVGDIAQVATYNYVLSSGRIGAHYSAATDLV